MQVALSVTVGEISLYKTARALKRSPANVIRSPATKKIAFLYRTRPTETVAGTQTIPQYFQIFGMAGGHEKRMRIAALTSGTVQKNGLCGTLVHTRVIAFMNGTNISDEPRRNGWVGWLTMQSNLPFCQLVSALYHHC